MNPARSSPSYRQSLYQIIGFDRLRFVNDVTNAVPQNEHCRILSLTFEGDGVRVDGRLTVQVDDERQLSQINRQLRSVSGLVRVTQITPS